MPYTPGPIGSTRYISLELADEATDFARDQLTGFGLTLANAIVRRVPTLAGSYYAIVPSGTTRARALEFKSGWPAPRLPDNPRWSGPIGLDAILAATTVILDLIQSRGQGFAIAEDFMCRPTDGGFEPGTTTLVAYDEVYEWSGVANPSFDVVREVVSLTNWGFVSNVVVATPHSSEEDVGSFNTPEEIVDYAANHATAVLMGAFDGEGYILWLPS